MKNNSGFTLAELLIVITILAVLGLSVLIAINPMLQIFKGYDTRRKDDLSKIKTAFEAYYSDHDCYPSLDIIQTCGSNALEPYLSSIPCDPTTKQPYTTYMNINESTTCPQQFIVYSKLSNTKDPEGNRIAYCPSTISQFSPNASYADTVRGCSGQQICDTLYGCRDGACVKLFVDTFPTCGLTSCLEDCSGIGSCSSKNWRGAYRNECR